MATLEALVRNPEPYCPPVAVARSRFYRPELDVLRFAAFLSVFFCHILPVDRAPQASGFSLVVWNFVLAAREAGNFGVCIFFLLSSYLITELLRRERLETNATHLRSFYIRRVLRIWPLYFAVLVIFVAGGMAWTSMRIEPARVLAYTLLVGNWYMVIFPLTGGPLRHLWSISVEEQFYITWPFLIKVGGMRSIKFASVAMLPASYLTIFFASLYGNHLDVIVWLNSVVQFQFFALGALLAIYFSGGTPDFSRRSRAAMLLSGVALWLVASGVFGIKRAGFTPHPAAMCAGYASAAIGSVLIFLAVLGIVSGRFSGSLVYLGKISYGLYVFHEMGMSLSHLVRKATGMESHAPAFFLLNVVLSLAFTILLAALSYKYLETPFLHLKKRFTFVESRSA